MVNKKILKTYCMAVKKYSFCNKVYFVNNNQLHYTFHGESSKKFCMGLGEIEYKVISNLLSRVFISCFHTRCRFKNLENLEYHIKCLQIKQ